MAIEPSHGTPDAPGFLCDDPRLMARYQAAERQLAGNLRRLYHHSGPVLIEGGPYPGIWLECGPLEGLTYARWNPARALENHRIFFQLRRPGGWLPCCVREQRIEFSQIQMVTPIAATALELAEQTGNEAFLRQAYAACAAWDRWLARNRNTRHTGLCEAFCTFDTGEDGSPRFAGLPGACPDGDARRCPPNPRLPYLAPDLSATVYGGRLALARMAGHLGRPREAAAWRAAAEHIRRAIFRWCYDPRAMNFFDRDAQGHLLRINSVALLVVLENHVPDARLAAALIARHVLNPREFWLPFPLPSIAGDDPAFNRAMPRDCWGGPSQALTALRAPRWLEHYGHASALNHLMRQWLRLLMNAPYFSQQADPWTGAMSTGRDYSPAMLVLLDFTSRLYGVRAASQELEWNCRVPGNAIHCEYRLPRGSGPGEAALRSRQPRLAAHCHSELFLSGRKILAVDGPARLITDAAGRPLRWLGTEPHAVRVKLYQPGAAPRAWILRPDQSVPI